MTKSGWWMVKFNLMLDGEQVRFDDLDECSQEHILQCIKNGCVQGEILQECDDDE